MYFAFYCFFFLNLWHLGQCDYNKDAKHNQTKSYVWVADYSQVVQADIGLLHFRKSMEECLS